MKGNRSFWILMGGEVISGVGLWLSVLGNLQFMGHLLSSDFLKSLVLMAGIFASVLILPISGTWIDRYDKRKLLFYSTLARCLSPLVMFLAIAYDSIAWMVVSVIIGQVAAATYYPTVRAALPSLVGEQELLRANTIFINTVTISRIAGTALGGVMISTLSLNWVFLVTLLAFIFMAAGIMFTHIPVSEKLQAQKDKSKVKFSEIFVVMKAKPILVTGIVITGIVTLFLGGFNLLVLTYGEIQESPSFMGWIYTVEGVSILAAGLFVRRVMKNANLIKMSIALVVPFAIAEFGMSIAHNGAIVLASYALFGCTVAFFFPVVTTVLQNNLDESIQGRFFSFKEIVDRILVQVSLLATGASLDLIGISLFLKGLAVLTLAAFIFAIFYNGFGNSMKKRTTISSEI